MKTVSQAIKAMQNGQDVILNMKYWERDQSRTFKAEHFAPEKRHVAFKHLVNCEKNDFKESATFHSGNKSDCKFSFSV